MSTARLPSLTGHIGKGTTYPTGHVSITLSSVTGTAVVDGHGNFTTIFTDESNAGSYVVTYSFMAMPSAQSVTRIRR